MSGWFSVKRGITSHPIFKGHPERLAIWIWLIDNACWADTPHDINGKIVTVPRGSVAASERRIAEEVGVGRQVVRTFLSLLISQHMVNPDLTHGRRIVSLCNWDKYQTPKPKANPATNPEPTQDQPIKEQKNTSVTNVTAAEVAAPVDPQKIAFDGGVRILGDAGMPADKARGLIGKWRKEFGAGAVIEALGRAHREAASDPVAFIFGCLRGAKPKGDENIHGAFGRIREVG